MMPDLLEALAAERTRDRQRSLAARVGSFDDPPSRRPHRVAVRFGYWLIALGCRLVAPDLTTAAL
jgi:hypothetical protein